jgi:hypothetical protein
MKVSDQLQVPTERAPGTLWIGGWVGFRIGVDAVVKTKILNPCRESNPRTPIIKVVIGGLIADFPRT